MITGVFQNVTNDITGNEATGWGTMTTESSKNSTSNVMHEFLRICRTWLYLSECLLVHTV